MTKKQKFALLASYVPEDAEFAAELKNFCEEQIEQIDTRAEKRCMREAERKAEGDELRDMVFGALTTELQTIPQIIDTIRATDPEVTPAQVTARLTHLFRAGEVEKISISLKGKRIMHYKLSE